MILIFGTPEANILSFQYHIKDSLKQNCAYNWICIQHQKLIAGTLKKRNCLVSFSCTTWFTLWKRYKYGNLKALICAIMIEVINIENIGARIISTRRTRSALQSVECILDSTQWYLEPVMVKVIRSSLINLHS